VSETKLDAKRIRRNPWITAATCLPWVIAAGLGLVTLLTGVPVAMVAPHVAIFGAVGFAAAWRRRPYARLEPTVVRVDEHVLRIGDEMIPRGRIQGAELLPTPFGFVVRVKPKNQLVRDIRFADDADAHRVLSALGFDASQRTATYRIMSLALVRHRFAPIAFAGVWMAMCLVAAASQVPWLIGFSPLFFLAMGVVFLKRGSLVVGVDGLLLRWLWVREFLATKDIISAAHFDQGFGRSRVRGVEVFTYRGGVKLPMGDEQAAMVRQRVVDVVAVARSQVHVADDALLARGSRGMRDWVTQLKALGSGATGTFRTMPVMPEQLWRVASDAAQPAHARAAAAVALSPTLDDSGRMRLADLAKTTAEPKLRVALERAAEGAPDEAIEAALSEVVE
jgi:hypothetical protein